MNKVKPLRIVGPNFRKRRSLEGETPNIILTNGACEVDGYIKNNRKPLLIEEEETDCADYREPYKAPREDAGENAPGFAPGDVWDISKKVRKFKLIGPYTEENDAPDEP